MYNVIHVYRKEEFCTKMFFVKGAHGWRPIVFATLPTKSLDDYTPVLHDHLFAVNCIIDLCDLNIFIVSSTFIRMFHLEQWNWLMMTYI